MSTLDEFILARSGVTMLPEQLKTLSEGELVVHTQRYLRAIGERSGYFKLLLCHQARGSSSKSSFGEYR